MYDDVPSVFVDTGLEYPEIKAFVKEINEGEYEPNLKSNVEIIRPKMRFDEVIKTEGYTVISKEVSYKMHYSIKAKEEENYTHPCYLQAIGQRMNKDGTRSMYNIDKYKYLLDAPFKIHSYCCEIMKKRPAKKYEKENSRKPFVGIMTTESASRKQAWIRTGCNAFESKRPISNPLSFWTEQDVYEYIILNNLPIAKVYGDVVKNDKDIYETTGVDRTGCMFCMFGAHLEKEPNRFQRMKETHPKQYEYCMKDVEDGGLGLRKVLEFIGVPYE